MHAIFNPIFQLSWQSYHIQYFLIIIFLFFFFVIVYFILSKKDKEIKNRNYIRFSSKSLSLKAWFLLDQRTKTNPEWVKVLTHWTTYINPIQKTQNFEFSQCPRTKRRPNNVSNNQLYSPQLTKYSDIIYYTREKIKKITIISYYLKF